MSRMDGREWRNVWKSSEAATMPIAISPKGLISAAFRINPRCWCIVNGNTITRPLYAFNACVFELTGV